MKLKRILTLFVVPLFLSSCWLEDFFKDEKQNPEGGDPIADILDFSKMSFADLKNFFCVKEDSIVHTVTTRTVIEKEYPTVKDIDIRYSDVVKNGDKYEEIINDELIYQIGVNEAVNYMNSIAEEPTYNENNIETALQNKAIENDAIFEKKDGCYIARQKCGPVSVYCEGKETDHCKKVYSEINDVLCVANWFNYDGYDDSHLTELPYAANGFSYNENTKLYTCEINQFNFDISQQFETGTINLKIEDNKIDSYTVHCFSEFEDCICNYDIEVSIECKSTTVTIPDQVGECDHVWDEYYTQLQSHADGEYYHFYECGKCCDTKSIEKCTFEDDVCTVCGNQPTKYVVLQKAPGEKQTTLVVGEVNVLNNKLLSIDIPLLGNYIFPEERRQEYQSLELAPGETLIYGDTLKYKDVYVVLVDVLNEDLTTTWYVIYNPVVTITDTDFIVSGGQVTSYHEGQIIQ